MVQQGMNLFTATQSFISLWAKDQVVQAFDKFEHAIKLPNQALCHGYSQSLLHMSK